MVAFDDFDALFVAVGRERLGKSTFMSRELEFCAAGLAHYIGGRPSDYFKPSDACLTVAQFVRAISDGKGRACKMLDEAGIGAYARESASGSNIDLNKELMTCGNKNNIMGLCIPDFFALDSFVRFHRALCVFGVYGVLGVKDGRITVERGYANVWPANLIPRIRQDPTTRRTKFPQTPYVGLGFRGYGDKEPRWAAYKERMNAQKNDFGRALADKLESKATKVKADARKNKKKSKIVLG